MRMIKELFVACYTGVLTMMYMLFLFISIILFSLIVFFKKILTRN